MISFPSVHRNTQNIFVIQLVFLSFSLLTTLPFILHTHLPPTTNTQVFSFVVSNFMYNMQSSQLWKTILEKDEDVKAHNTEKLSCKAISTILLSSIFPVFFFSNSLLYKYRHNNQTSMCVSCITCLLHWAKKWIHTYIHIYL